MTQGWANSNDRGWAKSGCQTQAAHDMAGNFERICRLITDPVSRRVQWGVAELARAIGVQGPQGVVVLKINRRELADLAGTTIYAVSRELNSLKRQGLIETSRGHIEVLQPSKLLEYLSGIMFVVAALGPLVAKTHLPL